MIRFFLMLALAASCWGCAAAAHRYDGSLEGAQLSVKEKRYPDALSSYDKIAKDSAGTERGAEALFAAAQLRAWYDNPSRDLAGALQRFDDFLKQYPGHEKVREAHNWRYYIKTVLDLRRDNEHLTKSIEQLKHVDIRHEERRKGR